MRASDNGYQKMGHLDQSKYYSVILFLFREK